MIILYRENFKRDTMSELLTLIQGINPNWTYSFNDDSEADVKLIEYTGINLPDTAEGLVKSTGELVISVVGMGCISECPRDFHAGMTDVKEHIRTYTYGR